MGADAQKYDLKRAHPALYAASAKAAREFVLVDVPRLRYLAVDGSGDPNTTDAYRQAVEALFGVAYTLKFASKAAGRDFVVGPLEGLWRADDPAAFVARDKAAWEWTMLIAQPDWIDADALAAAVAAVREKSRKKKVDPPAALGLVRLVDLHEGPSAQILHVGSYDDETPTLAHLHDEWMPQRGLTFAGDHHEIYLGDPRRTAPDKLKTILRQPVRPIAG